jgi:hypothetical protein
MQALDPRLGEWLKASPDKRVCQLEFSGAGFTAVCIERQGDGSGREATRHTAVLMADALNGAGRKLP